jgi:hypothetical protein
MSISVYLASIVVDLAFSGLFSLTVANPLSSLAIMHRLLKPESYYP